MTVDIGWVLVFVVLAFLTGFVTCLLAASVIKTRPMGSHHWTGSTHTAAVRQLFRDHDDNGGAA